MPPNQWNSHESKAQVKMFLKIFIKSIFILSLFLWNIRKPPHAIHVWRDVEIVCYFHTVKIALLIKRNILKKYCEDFGTIFFFKTEARCRRRVSYSSAANGGSTIYNRQFINTSIVSVNFTLIDGYMTFSVLGKMLNNSPINRKIVTNLIVVFYNNSQGWSKLIADIYIYICRIHIH